jgi:hypothetical protein
VTDTSRALGFSGVGGGFGQTITGTVNIAGDTWHLLKEALSEAGNESPGRGAQPSSPF